MAAKVRVGTQRLGKDAEQIQAYINSITTEIQNMKNSVANLESMWSGPGCRAFHHAFQDDIKAAQTIVENLKKILDYNQRAKSSYERCEREVSGMIEDIKV